MSRSLVVAFGLCGAALKSFSLSHDWSSCLPNCFEVLVTKSRSCNAVSSVDFSGTDLARNPTSSKWVSIAILCWKVSVAVTRSTLLSQTCAGTPWLRKIELLEAMLSASSTEMVFSATRYLQIAHEQTLQGCFMKKCRWMLDVDSGFGAHLGCWGWSHGPYGRFSSLKNLHKSTGVSSYDKQLGWFVSNIGVVIYKR